MYLPCISPVSSLYPSLSHCIPLYTSVFLWISLYPLYPPAFHCIPLYPLKSPLFSPCIPLYPLYSLYPPVFPYIPMYSPQSSCILLYSLVSPCIPSVSPLYLPLSYLIFLCTLTKCNNFHAVQALSTPLDNLYLLFIIFSFIIYH